MSQGKGRPECRRRILHVITTLEPAGAQTQLLDLARRLDPERFEVFIAFLYRPKHVRMLANTPGSDTPLRIIDLSRGGRFDPLVLPRLRALIRRERIDLVHTHLVHAGIVGKLAAASERRRVVTTRHYTSLGRDRRWTYRWEDRLTARADRVIAVSEAVRQYLLERRIADEARIRVIPNAVDLDRFDAARFPRAPHTAGEAPVIGTVGRLSPQKGHDLLVRAFAPLHASHGARLEIAGAGALAPELESLARGLGVGHAVRFYGAVSPETVPRLLAGWDLFAFPSRWEAFGLALVEAMAMGLPVVASGVEGILELVTPESTGTLVPVDDVSAWTEALRQALDDPVAARAMGGRARAAVAARFGLGAAAQSLSEVYRELLG